jgi:hypothetical protein
VTEIAMLYQDLSVARSLAQPAFHVKQKENKKDDSLKNSVQEPFLSCACVIPGRQRRAPALRFPLPSGAATA